MLRIGLFCAGGMSTSMLMEAMKESARKKGLEVDINAYPVASINTKATENDVVLLGPQIGYQFEDVKKFCDKHHIPSAVIPMTDYGRMNGKAVLSQALKLLEK